MKKILPAILIVTLLASALLIHSCGQLLSPEHQPKTITAAAVIGLLAIAGGGGGGEATTTTTTSTTLLTTTTTTTTTTLDTSDPSNVTISLNSGVATTETRTVTAEIHAEDDNGVVAYAVSEQASAPTYPGAAWTSITSSTNYTNNNVPYTLTGAAGAIRNVYVYFRDAAGNVASTSDSIYLTFVGVSWTAIYDYGDEDECYDMALGSLYLCGLGDGDFQHEYLTVKRYQLGHQRQKRL
jgi:hypothetical protein